MPVDGGHAESQDLVANLFRHESGRLAAALGRLFGPGNVDLAEDVVQDTLATALEAWRYQVPDNPSAWLTRVARNKAIDVLRRRATHRRFAEEHAADLSSGWTASYTISEALAERAADENQLRMMLTLCQEGLSSDTHVALILKYLCGFSAQELAEAFLTSAETTNKRLARGKAKLRSLGSLVAAEELNEASGAAQDSLLKALYLLFNEGYHGNNPSAPIRTTLCEEALRLCDLLLRAAREPLPAAHALAALMRFHYARIKGRLDTSGVFVPLAQQDRSLWDAGLINAGIEHLEASAEGAGASRYHLEAGIACAHCVAPSVEETDWVQILGLYEMLSAIAPSPLVSLNIALVQAMVGRFAQALAGVEALSGDPAFERSPFYWAAKAEILERAGRTPDAARAFSKAAKLSRNEAERLAFERRIRSIRTGV